jgi:DNA adenine methylase
MELDSTVKRPVLRYHGGKWLIAPWIISHFPAHRIYVEPYGGAGSVLLRKMRCFSEVYNDLDEEVVNLLSILRDRLLTHRLCELLELTPFSRVEFDQAYEVAADPLERARRLVIRSFQGFGSGSFNRDYVTGFRAASKQTGRPHALDWANIPECLWVVTERLKGIVIECRDALAVIKQQDHPDALFYVDPTYLESTRPNSNCKQYRFNLSLTDHIHLAEVLHSVKGKVVVSGYPSDLYDRELYADWARDTKVAQASGQHGRIQRTEVLWMNYSL